MIYREAWCREAESLERELERKLILLEKGELDPREFVRFFRRINPMSPPRTRYLATDVRDGDLVLLYTLEWVEAHREGYEEALRLDRGFGQLHDRHESLYYSWVELRGAQLGAQRGLGNSGRGEYGLLQEDLFQEVAESAEGDSLDPLESYHTYAAGDDFWWNPHNFIVPGPLESLVGKPVTWGDARTPIKSEAEAERLFRESLAVHLEKSREWVEETSRRIQELESQLASLR